MNSVYSQSPATTFAGQTSQYPVHVEFPILESHNRFYAIPLLGYMVKNIMLIPYTIAMFVLMLVVYVGQIVLWAPVLFTGTYPEWGRRINEGVIRWGKRSSSYLCGLTDRYPSFGLEEQPGDGDAMIIFERPETYSRFWAIPVIGIFAKSIILIPHFVVLYVLGLIVSVVQLVTWIPVLFGGHYPLWGYQLVGGWIRWSARVAAYTFGLTDQYPPFSLAE